MSLTDKEVKSLMVELCALGMAKMIDSEHFSLTECGRRYVEAMPFPTGENATMQAFAAGWAAAKEQP